MRDLLPLVEAHHVLGRNELDERELRRHRDRRRKGRLARPGRAVEEDRYERSALAGADLLDEELAVAEDVVNVVVKVDDAVLDDRVELLLVDSKRGLDLFERVEEVVPADLDLVDVIRNAGHGAHLDVAVEGETGG